MKRKNKIEKVGIDQFIGSLNFKEMNNLDLVPTIVQDIETKQVLMLAYSSKKSLLKTFETEKAWYYSRKRRKLWMKGESSGNTQKIIDIKTDCDNDTLLFVVKQKGNACHLNRLSCFGKREFSLMELARIIRERIKSENKNSYTYKLYRNPKLLRKKILEEAKELVRAKNKKQVIWETADLLYFMLVFLAKRQVALDEVEAKLMERNKNKGKLGYYKKKEEKWKQ